MILIALPFRFRKNLQIVAHFNQISKCYYHKPNFGLHHIITLQKASTKCQILRQEPKDLGVSCSIKPIPQGAFFMFDMKVFFAFPLFFFKTTSGMAIGTVVIWKVSLSNMTTVINEPGELWLGNQKNHT